MEGADGLGELASPLAFLPEEHEARRARDSLILVPPTQAAETGFVRICQRHR